MSKKKIKSAASKASDEGTHSHKQWFLLNKGDPGKVHIEWSGEYPLEQAPEMFNLTYIDSVLATQSINYRVLGYHVGHDHGYGWRHRHLYQNTNRLDDTYLWDKCASEFISDCGAEIKKNNRPVPSSLCLNSIIEVMT